MIHILLITLYVWVISPDGERSVSIREYPQPFTSREACEQQAALIEEAETEAISLNLEDGWSVIVDARCRPPA